MGYNPVIRFSAVVFASLLEFWLFRGRDSENEILPRCTAQLYATGRLWPFNRAMGSDAFGQPNGMHVYMGLDLIDLHSCATKSES